MSGLPSSVARPFALLVLLGVLGSAGKFAGVAWVSVAAGADSLEIAIDSAMQHDPEFRFSGERSVFVEGLADLWIECLARPETDLKREAAETIARAHKRGLTGLDAAVAPLAARLEDKQESPSVRLAAARALVVLEAREKAGLLAETAADDGLQMSLAVEPALARWNYAPARQRWLARLRDGASPAALRKLAIAGLGTTRTAAALAPLKSIVLDPAEAIDLRLAAARAVAEIGDAEIEQSARKLLSGRAPDIGERLLAATLISRSSGTPIEALLLELGADREPAVAAVAWRRLVDIDPELTAPLMAKAAASLDANLRRLSVEAMFMRPTAERVATMAPLLNDPHPQVRVYVRQSLYSIALDDRAPLREVVITEAAKVLAAPSTAHWRGHEQAAMLLAALDHKQVAGRLVELLDAPRPEAFIAASWALRKLAVPETYPKMLDKAERETAKSLAAGDTEPEVDFQLTQIFETFGLENYAPAEKLMRTYIPKTRVLGDSARCAAVWSLGRLHAGAVDQDLSAQLADRLADDNPLNPESLYVRAMAAVSLGRMKDESQIPVLRKYQAKSGPNNEVGYACAWSIHQMTGEPLPVNVDVAKHESGWFMEPLQPRRPR